MGVPLARVELTCHLSPQRTQGFTEKKLTAFPGFLRVLCVLRGKNERWKSGRESPPSGGHSPPYSVGHWAKIEAVRQCREPPA